jgi:hypothetical protein
MRRRPLNPPCNRRRSPYAGFGSPYAYAWDLAAVAVGLPLAWMLSGLSWRHVRLRILLITFCGSELFLFGIRLLSKSPSVYVYTSYVAPLLQLLFLTLVGHLERSAATTWHAPKPHNPVRAALQWLADWRAARRAAASQAKADAAEAGAAAAAAVASAAEAVAAVAAREAAAAGGSSKPGEQQQSDQKQPPESPLSQQQQKPPRPKVVGDPTNLSLEDVMAGALQGADLRAFSSVSATNQSTLQPID